MKTSYYVCQLVRWVLKPPLLITRCLAQLNRYFKVNIKLECVFNGSTFHLRRLPWQGRKREGDWKQWFTDALIFHLEILPHYLYSTWGCSVLLQCSHCHRAASVQGQNHAHTWFAVPWRVLAYHSWQKPGLGGTFPVFIHIPLGQLLHKAF